MFTVTAIIITFIHRRGNS